MINMKMSVIFIALVAVAAVASGQSCGSMSTSDGNYTFSWIITDDNINGIITVRGIPVGRWAAVGFSEDKLMTNSDAIIGGNNGAGHPFVEDRWITDERTPDNVVYDESQDISFISATISGDVLTIRFTRPLNTSDSMDVAIGGMDDNGENNCVYVLWAYGGSVGNFSTTPKSGLTGHTARGVFPQQLCGSMTFVVSLGVLLLGALIATFAMY